VFYVLLMWDFNITDDAVFSALDRVSYTVFCNKIILDGVFSAIIASYALL